MEHINPLSEFRYVKDTVLNARMDTNLINSRANACHRLPVGGLQPMLDEMETVPRMASRILRECSYVFER